MNFIIEKLNLCKIAQFFFVLVSEVKKIWGNKINLKIQNPGLKSIHFKKTVAKSSFLSKVLSFLLTLFWFQRKWQHFWKKWGLHNCLLKVKRLYKGWYYFLLFISLLFSGISSGNKIDQTLPLVKYTSLYKAETVHWKVASTSTSHTLAY